MCPKLGMYPLGAYWQRLLLRQLLSLPFSLVCGSLFLSAEGIQKAHTGSAFFSAQERCLFQEKTSAYKGQLMEPSTLWGTMQGSFFCFPMRLRETKKGAFVKIYYFKSIGGALEYRLHKSVTLRPRGLSWPKGYTLMEPCTLYKSSWYFFNDLSSSCLFLKQ